MDNDLNVETEILANGTYKPVYLGAVPAVLISVDPETEVFRVTIATGHYDMGADEVRLLLESFSGILEALEVNEK